MDRLLTVKEVATYLHVHQRTVIKLAAEGALPAARIGNQWRFRPDAIDSWLDDQTIGIRPRYVEAGTPGGLPAQVLDLENCFQPEQIVPRLDAVTKTAAIEELAGLASHLGLVRDKTWFVGALIERENVMSSAVGHGLAFPHTLRRHPEQIVRPFMVLGRSAGGIPFEAVDGAPTHLIFLLGLRHEALYLPWLTKLTRMLARSEAMGALLDAPDAQSIYDELAAAEERLG